MNASWYSNLSPGDLQLALVRSHGSVSAITDRMQRRDEQNVPMPRPIGPPSGVTARDAAVLLLLYPGAEDLALVFTRRPDHLRNHGGQISFPGGALEPDDGSLLKAALRETHEELGVSLETLQYWTDLKPVYVPPSNYLVHPFVAYVPERPRFTPGVEEVAEVLEVPLTLLLDDDSFVRELRDYQGRTIWEGYFLYKGLRIWGATAVILDQFLERIRTGLADSP